MATRVKICGITNVEDAATSARLGADMLGFIFARRSPRCITTDAAARIARTLPAFQQTVGVFLDASSSQVIDTCAEAGLGFAQLHGGESPDDCARVQEAGLPVIKVLTIASVDDLRPAADYDGVAAFLLDRARGGPMYDWAIASEAAHTLTTPVMVAGGLTPDNVASAIAIAHPYAVDVGSGVESAAGKKDAYKLAAFLNAARS
ncbi:N-(5'-phosphoribosyl)anthranilate isomerase [Candidatus Poribacteria bacterium]|nr:N-(5'-phosphoribosyl)anthranilate isomerase [Candidatus Poribacteria bacterium]